MDTKIIWKVDKDTKLVESVNQFIKIMREQKIDLITFTFEYDNELIMYRLYAYPLYKQFSVDYYNV